MSTPLPPAAPEVTVDDFRARFPEFSANGDEQVQVALDDSLPWNGYPAWGSSYVKGVCTLAAHMLAVSNQRAPAAGSGGSGAARPPTGIFTYVTGRKAGALSTSYAASSGSGAGGSSGGSSAAEGWLGLSSYGQEWYAMARIKGMGAAVLTNGDALGYIGTEAWR